MSLIHDKTSYVSGAVIEVLLRQVGVFSLDLLANMSENSEGFLKGMAKQRSSAVSIRLARMDHQPGQDRLIVAQGEDPAGAHPRTQDEAC